MTVRPCHSPVKQHKPRQARRDYDWQLERVAVNRAAPFVGKRGKQGKAAVYRHPTFWRPQEIRFLHETYGRAPLSEIAKSLGRTRMAVSDMAERMGIPPTQNRTDVWTVDQLAAAFGIWAGSAHSLWLRGDIPTVTLYMADKPVRMVVKAQILHFAGNPLNWYALPPIGRWVDPELKRVRDIALVTWRDEWVRTKEAGRMLNIAPGRVKDFVKAGELTSGKMCCGYWYVLKSDLQALAQRRGWVFER